jgi:hypothetical protein
LNHEGLRRKQRDFDSNTYSAALFCLSLAATPKEQQARLVREASTVVANCHFLSVEVDMDGYSAFVRLWLAMLNGVHRVL